MGWFFFFQAEDGIRDYDVTGVQTCALPISMRLIAREEMVKGRPILVDAEEVAADDPELIHGIALKKGMIANPEDGVETLLAMREKWHKERATETREWLGPDPGIDEVRQQTIDNGLHLRSEERRVGKEGRSRWSPYQ